MHSRQPLYAVPELIKLSIHTDLIYQGLKRGKSSPFQILIKHPYDLRKKKKIYPISLYIPACWGNFYKNKLTEIKYSM